MLLKHAGDDGGGAAHRLVAHAHRLRGLNIRQTVVVDDLQNLRLLQTGHGLRHLVMVHQHHPLTAGTQQVIARQRAHHMLVFIQHRIAAETAFQHHFLHIVNIVIQMEADQILRVAGTGDGDGLINQAGYAAGVKGRGDNAGIPCALQPLRLHLTLAQNHGAYADIQRTADNIRLAAAQHDGIG